MNFLYSNLRCNIGMYLTQLLALTQEKNENALVTYSSEVKTTGPGREKTLSSAIHLAVLMQCILMGFLQVALCSTSFPQWECFLPAAEPGCANSGDIQVSGPEPCQAPCGRAQHNMRLTTR